MKRVTTISNCENINVTIVSGVTRIGNCVDCSISTYSHYGAPIIYGDTRNLTIAPHNAGYTELGELVTKSGINT